jgi:hypothetical protein
LWKEETDMIAVGVEKITAPAGHAFESHGDGGGLRTQFQPARRVWQGNSTPGPCATPLKPPSAARGTGAGFANYEFRAYTAAVCDSVGMRATAVRIQTYGIRQIVFEV